VPSLQIRRIRKMTLETYTIVNKLAPVCLHDLVNVKNSKYAFRYSNILDVSYTKPSALSCTFSIFFEFVSVQKCQAKGQKLKLLRMKVWNIVNLLNLSKHQFIYQPSWRTMALETYKIVNKLAPVCLHELVNVKNSKYAFRYSNILDVSQGRTTRYGKISFMFAAETLCSDLPRINTHIKQLFTYS
jgi:hypothetical protein